jgi:hypothetical protein
MENTDRSKTAKESIIYSTKDLEEPAFGSNRANEREDKDDIIYVEGNEENEGEFIPIVPKSPIIPSRKTESQTQGNFVIVKDNPFSQEKI